MTKALVKSASAKAAKKTTAKKTTATAKPATPPAQPNAESQPKTKQYDVDISKGEVNSVLSRQWATRPADQRFTSFEELAEHVRTRKAVAQDTQIEVDQLSINNGEVTLDIPGIGEKTQLNWFTSEQLLRILGVDNFQQPLIQRLTDETASSVFRDLLSRKTGKALKALSYHYEDQAPILAALNTTTYGRIYDADIVNIVEYLLATDPRWKIPGQLDWSAMQHNPHVDITKDNTTLYASDKDIFMFFCQDNNPIEAGKTPSGKPDVYFKGFYVYNSEVGAGKAGMATMMLRGVCANRNLWGVEGFKETKIRHTKNSMDRFRKEALNSMYYLKQADETPFVQLLAAAKAKTLAHDDEEAAKVLHKAGFTKKDAAQVLQIGLDEEEVPMRTAYDFTQGVTAFARRIPFEDKRQTIELKANEFLEAAA